MEGWHELSRGDGLGKYSAGAGGCHGSKAGCLAAVRDSVQDQSDILLFPYGRIDDAGAAVGVWDCDPQACRTDSSAIYYRGTGIYGPEF